MRIHQKWTKRPMSTLAIHDNLAGWARRLEDAEARRLGLPIAEARAVAARAAGVSPGTLENLRRGRIKSPSAWLVEKLHAAVCRQIEKQITGLQHELEVARRISARPDSDDIRAAEAALAAAKLAMRGSK